MSNLPPIISYRVRRVTSQGIRISPPYATLEAAQMAAKLSVQIHANMGKPCLARVISSISKPKIDL